MTRRPPKRPPLKQPTPPELLESLLSLVQAKFYQGHAVAFAKDRPRILAWVIFEPARWLREKAVTLPPARYGEILRRILLDAAAHGNMAEVNYLPAYLRQVVQKHFAHHGDEIYDEAKSIRNALDRALAVAGTRPAAGPDVVEAFTAAKRLLQVAKGKRTAQRGVESVGNKQLSFL